MHYIWFWTFWHWSREGFRDGALLRGPLHGIGGHWDEWYRHEASPIDRRAIADVGRSERAQRRFVAWLARRWAREAVHDGERPPVRFVLAQLAQVAPFDGWSVLARYRATYGVDGVDGVAAVVLAERSAGEAGDVRAVEGALLPRNPDVAAPAIFAEGFEVDPVELDAARRAAMTLLAGRGTLRLLGAWVLRGRRPYPAWVRETLNVAWGTVAAIMAVLVFGPEPGDALPRIDGALLALWAALVLVAGGVAIGTCVQAWRLGSQWRARLATGEVRLRMDDRLIVTGGSAGLAFCLNMLHAAAAARPHGTPRSWLWRRFHTGVRADRGAWAATGVVSANGRVDAVVLAPKLRAALLHTRVRHLLVPGQRGASPRHIAALGAALADTRPVALEPVPGAHVPPGGVDMRAGSHRAPGPRLGFATSAPRLRVHRCRHVAAAVMAVGGLGSTTQPVVNAFTAGVSAAMVVALPDLRHTLWPPPAPAVVAPASPSPYYLWVSLDTPYPNAFAVELESDYWANRRSVVTGRGDRGDPPHAELRLLRAVRPGSLDAESGTVWVERRRRFLTREFLAGERVGRYTVAYVTRAGRDQ